MAPADIAFGLNTAFIVGIFISSLTPRPLLATVFLFLAILALRKFSAARPNSSSGRATIAHRVTLLNLCLFALAMFFGIFLYRFNANHEIALRILPEERSKAPFVALVLGEPRPRGERAESVSLKLLPPNRGVVEAILVDRPDVRYGDRIALTGGRWEVEDNGPPTLLFPKHIRIGRGEGRPIFQALADIRRLFLGALRRFVPGEPSALLAGLTIGATEDFTGSFRDALRRSGTTHLVAVSGYNIGVIAIGAAAIFSLWLSRKLAFAATTAVIIAFVIITGAESSVVRAGVMGLLMLTAKHFGRPYGIRYAIAFAATTMLFLNPTLLVENIGFQLSFLSLLGITYLAPVFQNLWFGAEAPPGIFAWRENLATTAAAQLAVLPIVVSHFEAVSPAAIGANILILPVVPITMALGGLVALGSILAPLAEIIGRIVTIFLVYQITIINIFAALPSVTIPVLASAGGVIIYYGGLIAIITKYRPRPENNAAKRP
ncbi:MAG: ComEC/Rec2 family competence protein [Patescibacteria group bacterium]